MWGRREKAYPKDALFREHYVRFLGRDEVIEPVADEVVYAYVNGHATAAERAEVEEAMLRSKPLCAEVLEIAQYMDAMQPREERGGREEGEGFLRGMLLLLRRPRLALVASIVIVALVGALFTARLLRGPGPLPQALHLVVMPLSCEGGTGDAAFCNGLAETMTQKVSLFERFNPSFWVVPADAVAKAEVTDPTAAGNQFGASMALTGRFVRLRDNFQLTLELVNLVSPTPTPLRSAVITGPMKDLAMLQSAIVRRVGDMLGMQRLAGQPAFDEGDTDVSGAYRDYVEGQGHLRQYEQMAELQSAVEAFTRALTADSTYALARTGLAKTYWRMFRLSGDAEWIAKAKDESARSLAMDSTLALTHVVYGDILNESGEYAQAAVAFERAASIDSTATGLYNGLAESYAHMDRLNEAEATYQRAIAVKPDYWGGYSDLGLFYYRHGRYQEAAQQYLRMTELAPNNYLGYSNLAAMYYYLERWPEAKRAFERSIEIHPSDRACLSLSSVYYIEGNYDSAAVYSERAVELNPSNYKAWSALGNSAYWVPGQRNRAIEAYRRAIELAETRLEVNPKDQSIRVRLASYYAVVGEPDTARSYVETVLASHPDSPITLYYAGYVYEQIGERDRALDLIGEAVDRGYPVDEIERDPWLTDLRADPRYQQMLDSRK